MEDRPLIHWGIPGMKWGVRRRAATARMDKSGNVTVIRKGKRVPVMVTRRGKKVQLNGRQLSNKTRAKAAELFTSFKNKFSKDLTVTKVAYTSVVAAMGIYNGIKLAQLFKEIGSSAPSGVDINAYNAWLKNG